jgi:putative transposase
VLDEVAAWQNRPLEATYAIVFFDALRVKIRDEGVVKNKAVYLAIGMRCSGHKEILGLWIEQTEGAKFWLRVMSEMCNRGTGDILLAVVDGLKGFPEAISAVFPDTVVQTCIVHLIRYSMQFVLMEGAQGYCRHAQADLQSRQRRTGQAALGRLRSQPLGRQVPSHRAILATQLGAGDSVLRLRPAGAQDRLHHKCHREPAQSGQKSGAWPRPFPQRRSGQ